MGGKTGIEWTDVTWNPITGCDRISPGCDNCYAATMAARLQAMGNPRYQRDGEPPRSGPGFGLTVHEDLARVPLQWQKPRRVFVNSMSDLFHEDVPESAISWLFNTMGQAYRHQFQILTKRARRMQKLIFDAQWATGEARFNGLSRFGRNPFRNVWLGVSAEDQEWADNRIPWLMRTPAAVRFVSCEPLLGPINLTRWLDREEAWAGRTIDWVIVGGESGPNRRPFNPDWARRIRDQCVEAGVPFFYKQGSAFRPGQDRELDGRTWDEYPA